MSVKRYRRLIFYVRNFPRWKVCGSPDTDPANFDPDEIHRLTGTPQLNVKFESRLVLQTEDANYLSSILSDVSVI